MLVDTSKNPPSETEPQYTTLAELEALLTDGEEIEASLPSYHALQTAVSHARDWLSKVGTSFYFYYKIMYHEVDVNKIFVCLKM